MSSLLQSEFIARSSQYCLVRASFTWYAACLSFLSPLCGDLQQSVQGFSGRLTLPSCQLMWQRQQLGNQSLLSAQLAVKQDLLNSVWILAMLGRGFDLIWCCVH